MKLAQEEKNENIFFIIEIERLLVMQHFRVVYTLGKCVYQENISDKWDISKLHHDERVT